MKERRTRTTLCLAVAGVAFVAACYHYAWADDGQVISSATAARSASVETRRPVAATTSDSIPGTGVVDVPHGRLHEVEPFDYYLSGITPGEPVKVGGPDNKAGWVEWEDFSPSHVPVDERIPRAMVPIRDKAGRQIAWWSTMGWITFETVSQPGYDFVAEYERYLDENRPDTCEEYEQMAGIDGVCADPPS